MSVLLKLANKYNDEYKYNWKDPITRPPAPRDINELETLSKHTSLTGLGGAVLGTAAGVGTSLLMNPIHSINPRTGSKHSDYIKKINRRNLGNAIKGGVLGAGAGFGAGSIIGEYRGGKKILKNREKRKAPSYTKDEIESISERRRSRGAGSGLKVSIDPQFY
jgi:hypothetical protein